jgi:hypothetical protein
VCAFHFGLRPLYNEIILACVSCSQVLSVGGGGGAAENRGVRKEA